MERKIAIQLFIKQRKELDAKLEDIQKEMDSLPDNDIRERRHASLLRDKVTVLADIQYTEQRITRLRTERENDKTKN